ncbi:MAG: type II toxin-antitoxin system VapC family toxin [Planctomycetota bacterium]
MKLFDANVLIDAYHPAPRNSETPENPRHEQARRWLEAEINRSEPFGMAELVLSGFLGIVTSSKIFTPPVSTDAAIVEIDRLRKRPNCVMIRPGPRHYDIFTNLCRQGNAKGKLIADAYLAPLAVEHGCQWVSYDRDFARFPGLTWIDPGQVKE